MNKPRPAVRQLDLRRTKCPLNFVQSRLALEKLAPGEVLEVWLLAEAESAINIPQSLAAEGHTQVAAWTDPDGVLHLQFERG